VVAQVRVLGGTVGLAISTIVFNSEAQQTLSKSLTPSELSAVLKSPAVARNFTLRKQIAFRLVFAQSFNDSMRICTYVTAACLFIVVFAYQREPPNILEKKAQLDALVNRGMERTTENGQTPDMVVGS
jgi:hypothetical protein